MFLQVLINQQVTSKLLKVTFAGPRMRPDLPFHKIVSKSPFSLSKMGIFYNHKYKQAIIISKKKKKALNLKDRQEREMAQFRERIRKGEM